MDRTKVFVSYSRDDREWLARLANHLAVLERQHLIEVWSDTCVAAGADWESEIEGALAGAKVAVLMISPAFLASSYIWDKEIGRIVAHSTKGMDVLPLIVRPCAWRLEGALARLQARPGDDRALSRGTDSQIDQDLRDFTYELAARIGRSPAVADPPHAEPREHRRGAAGLLGTWTGYYAQTRLLKLTVRKVEEPEFHGELDYPSEGTTTVVKGAFHERWSPSDPVWAQLRSAEPQGAAAVSFHETGYKTKGSRTISFDGEYRALVSEREMSGAWFSAKRLVGPFSLTRIDDPSRV